MKKIKDLFFIFYKLINKILLHLKKDKITVYAAQASFFIIISSVPLIMLSIICIQYIIPFDRNTFNEIIVNLLPSDNDIFKFIDNIISELYGRTDISIISITAITLLWSASRGFKSIATGIRNIYGSLTAIILLILWMYFGIIILFLGAEINVLFYKRIMKESKSLTVFKTGTPQSNNAHSL